MQLKNATCDTSLNSSLSKTIKVLQVCLSFWESWVTTNMNCTSDKKDHLTFSESRQVSGLFIAEEMFFKDIHPDSQGCLKNIH